MSEVTTWSTTAADNISVGGVSIAEGWAPENVNNAIRAVMAAVADGIDDGDFAVTSGFQPLDGTLTALAALTIANGKLVKGTGADAFSLIDISAYGETLINLASAAALKSALSAVTVTASSIANPGYVSFDLTGDGAADFTVQWGSDTVANNATATISYPISFTTFAIPVGSGGSSTASREGDVHVSSGGLSSFGATNSAGVSSTFYWIAVGK